MKKISHFAIVIMCFSLSAFGQSQDSVILKAMKDELSRSMQKLLAKGADSPFFISYAIRDSKSWSAEGKWGALTYARGSNGRSTQNARVMVGNPAFNDESLDDVGGGGGDRGFSEIALPEDNDYEGIRRSLWITTDQIYQRAVAHYHRNFNVVKETNKKLEEIAHRSFFTGKPIHLVESLITVTLDTVGLKQMSSRLSGNFLKLPGVRGGGVTINYSEGYLYTVNSEGTVARQVEQNTRFSSNYATMNKEGAPVNNWISFSCTTPAQLPSELDLAAGIKKMIRDTEAGKDAAALTDPYEGPVLLSGYAAASFLFRIFSSSLQASDYVVPLTGMNFGNRPNNVDSKIGKNVVNESITLTARPKLRTFQGVNLPDSFSMDNEGIAPPDELVLIEKGILKELLNNRTLTGPDQKSNGFSGHIGTLEFSSAAQFEERSLKTQLLARAKEQGLEFALIIRPASASFTSNVLTYKVFVNDGHEELIQNISWHDIGLKSLKRLMGVTGVRKAYIVRPRDGGGFGVGEDYFDFAEIQMGPQFGLGFLNQSVSMIIPEGILVDDLEARAARGAFYKERQEFVKSPWE